MSRRKVVLGKFGEQKAVEYLQKRKYKILEQNFRSRFGEIDIVALDNNFLVFVEVKTRWSRAYGLPEEAVTSRKMRSIMKTAQYYKMLHPKTPDLMRVDVISVEPDQPGSVLTLRHLKNVI